MALEQPALRRVQLGAAEQDVVGQRLLADVVQQPGRVHDRLLALAQPGGARELARVVGDGRGVAGGARVAQRERLSSGPSIPSWRTSSWSVRRTTSSPCAWPSQQRPQQQLADAEREREQADDAGAVDLEAETAIAVSDGVASSHGSTGR